MGRLLISAAHTLENPGAIYQDLREADLTRKLLKLCIPHLEKSGIVFQAVPLDLPLLQRIEWINATGYTEQQGDIMVELHINDGGKRGVESWYRGSAAPDNKSQKLSERIAEHICEKTSYTNLGAKSEYEHELTSLLILNSINVPGTCLETLYIDNPDDISILKDDKKFDDLAKTIVDAIKDFLDDPAKNAKTVAAQPAAQTVNVQSTSPVTPVIQPQIPTAAPAAVTNDIFGAGAGLPAGRPAFGGGNPASSAPRPFGGLGATAMGGANSAFGAGGGFGGAPGFGGAGNKATLMDRDERKKMIKEIYQMILGKDPKPADENYYLNTGATREELIKKLTESEDFKKMLEDAKRAKELDDKIQKLQSEVETLKANSSDAHSIQESMNKLLEQKNIMIYRLYQELVQHGIIQQGEHYESRNQANKAKQSLQPTSGTTTSDSLGKKLTKLVMRFTKV